MGSRDQAAGIRSSKKTCQVSENLTGLEGRDKGIRCWARRAGVVVLLAALLLLGMSLVAGGPVTTVQAEALPQASTTPLTGDLLPSSYCQSCHVGGIPGASAGQWLGINGELMAVYGCPAAGPIQDELYYTERLLLAIERGRASLPDNAQTASLDTRLAATRETYHRLLDAPFSSLEAYRSEALALRYKLGKLYTEINQIGEARKRQNVLLFAGLVTLALLASLGWGWYNAHQATKARAPEPAVQAGPFGKDARRAPLLRAGPRPAVLVFVLLVFGFFALPLFSTVSAPVEASDAEALALQSALDTAQRSALAADQAQARIGLLGELSAAWQAVDEVQAEAVLQSALQLAEEAQTNSLALWGQASAAQEAAVSDPAKMENAALTAAEMDASRQRVWGLRVAAEAWAGVDHERAAELLEMAEKIAAANQTLYGDLDLHAVAIAWVFIDIEHAEQTAAHVQDPGLRSRALREIAVRTTNVQVTSRLYESAAEAARQVTDPLQRVRLLSRIGEMKSDQALFSEAQAAADQMQGEALAQAQLVLAAASQDAQIAGQIDPTYPLERAQAQLWTGNTQRAWQESLKIGDTYRRARVQEQIASYWADESVVQAAEAAGQIEVPLFRERAKRRVDISGKALLAQLESPYDRVLALTYIPDYEQAADLADELKDTYPLIYLASRWVYDDRAAAMEVVEKIQREADRMLALYMMNVTGEQAIFERALNLAPAARVRGDPLAPGRFAYQLGRPYQFSQPERAEAAFQLAYDLLMKLNLK